MNVLLRSLIASVVRHAFTGLGMALSTHGITLLDDKAVEQATGALMFLVGLAWSVWRQWKKASREDRRDTAETAGALALVIGISVAVGLLTGCAQDKAIVANKSTVLGFDFSTDPATRIPHMRLGLIRNFSQVVPVMTNGTVGAPAYRARMNADLKTARQQVDEDFATGDAALVTTNTFTASVTNFVRVTAKTNAAPAQPKNQ